VVTPAARYPAPFYTTRIAHWAALLAVLQRFARRLRRTQVVQVSPSRWRVIARARQLPDT
jgi:hypothetical protein